jgi:hypothetical protein
MANTRSKEQGKKDVKEKFSYLVHNGNEADASAVKILTSGKISGRTES